MSSRPEFAENRAMYSDGWTWHPLTLQALKDHVIHGRVLISSRNGQPSALCILLDEDKVLTMGFVAGVPRDVGKLIRMFRFLMFRKKCGKLRILLPSKSRLVPALQRSGFEKVAKILVYQKFLG